MKELIGIVVLGLLLSACGGGGSSSSRDSAPQASTPPPAAPTPAPSPIDDVADYQLQKTADVLASVEQRLQGLPIAQFFEEAYRVTAERDPESILSAGLADEFQLAAVQLTDISDDYYFQTVEVQKRIRELLLAIDKSSLAADDQLSYEVYLAFLDLEIEGATYRDFQYPASYGFWGWPGNTDVFFTQLAPLNNKADAENYLVLLNQLGRRFRQVEALLDTRAAAGVREPFFTFDFSRSQVASVAAGNAAGTSYYRAFSDKLSAVGTIDSADKEELRDRALALIEQRVLPAYGQLGRKMADMLGQAPQNIGFGQFEGGAAFYRYALRFFTSSHQTPDEIHQLGLAHLERIHTEMRLLFDQLGYPADESLADLLARVDIDGGTVIGSEAVAFFENLIARAEAELVDTFAQLPAQKVRVIGGPSGGFYIKGSDDGTRPGAFYAQTTGDLPYATMPTLAYHEALPGHHLQIALAQEQDLPRFRRTSTFTSYVEGWGLYAERLAKDLGWYENDPYGDLGRLRFEAMRAARLVLDTGIHDRGWTVEQAQQFNRENVGDSGSIARYSVSPGQASAYMTGMLKILALRQRSQQQLGELYDIADFHTVVVGSGSMPLNLLKGAVNHYIAETLAAAQ